ncbi:sodium/bile acid cotransporter 7 [Plasticicumulans lactativorans]|uniref:Sodium/bile acid cotransporter 7 n=1 Tax=Plasticicumulans lactativorans TaxID=1133106 RepID=A0A4R2LG39_9GAMM|nr:bile acid:sodium symporter family protein [Plasticicumulans lactativorans]TCO83814.1 sodium/bile acid cotransporter 7 [Plasticicumulans lactativorans]
MLAHHLKRMSRDWFLGGMVAAVVLATLFPHLGSSSGPLHTDLLTDAGIFAVFFLHGIGLSTHSLKAGLLRWRLHLLVQTFTFAVFPLLWIAARATLGGWLPADLLLGFLYLCALPSTISSSVAMTAMARGNVPAAIFNATLSSLLGIVLTPLLIGLLAGASGQGLALGQAVLDIARLLLLPFALGQALRPLCGAWFARYKRFTNTFDKCVILLLVYASFCDSVLGGLWTRYGVDTLLLTLVGAAILLAIVLLLTTRAAARLGFSVEDEITAVFCGSKKTLASGMPMAKLLFGAHPALGMIVLPIMFYHPLQLLVCSVLAERYARRPAAAAVPATA